MMEDRNQEITEYLQREDVQARIHQRIHRGRSEASVTISNAARLFGFTENQLRDWDEKGLLKPQRPPLEFTQDGKNTKRRQYAPAELDKLAVIRELMDKGFSPGTIPPNIDELWKEINAAGNQGNYLKQISGKHTEHLPIDRRIEYANETLFYRFYALHALRLSLTLICEEMPDAVSGLVLPFHAKNSSVSTLNPENFPNLGESLIGWLDSNNTFYVLLDSAPSFEHPSDFRIHLLQATKNSTSFEDVPKDNTLIVLQRKSKPLALSVSVVETVQRLLAPLYEHVQDYRNYFAHGLREIVYPSTDFNNSTSLSETILNHLANMVVQLGGKSQKIAGQDRWRFCCILLPNNPLLPMQQRWLVVRAQSKAGPHTLGVTLVSPEKSVISLSLRAFQSGHIMYRSDISIEDATIFDREVEGPIHSAIAVPVEGEDGSAIAVIYVVSDETEAFPEADQRLLRVIGRMIEELLLTFRIRQEVVTKLTNIMTRPRVVDSLFRDFFSENSFIYDVEKLLTGIQEKMPEKGTETGEKEISFISVDIDNQTTLGSKNGDRVTRNLSRALGERINSQLRVLFTRRADWRFYYIYADRYYILLDGTPLDQACEKAQRLREVLQGDYKVDALRTSIDQSTLPGNMLKLTDLSVRLGVTSYEYWKLAELLQRSADTTPVASVRSLIIRFLDIALSMGNQAGGGTIIAWNREKWKLAPWPPHE